MTVSVLRNKSQYTGNASTTQFAVQFPYTEVSQVKVYLDGSLQTLTTHYSITDPDQTGTVTFVTAPGTGVVVTLLRETDYLQTIDYANNDILDAETLESAFDKLTMMCQQLKGLIDNSVGFDETVSSAETTSLKLAAGITDLAGKLLAFDDSGNFVTTQEIGTWRGDYSGSTAYVVRDIVKDASTDNVYFTKQDAPAGTALTNTTYFALLVDVETVRTLKEAAELAETNAETAQAAAEAALASFQGQYKVGATNPYSGTPDAGDLWYDTTNSILKYYVTGTGFEPVTTSLATVSSNYLTISNQVITAGTVPIVLGGTGATTASAARTALDVDQAGTDNSTDVTLAGSLDYLTISGQEITRNAIDLTTDVSGALPIANGGTNSTTASGARTALGLVIGTDVQAYDADLTALGGLAKTDGNFIVGNGTTWTVESGATARTSLGLGSAATSDTGDFEASGTISTHAALTSSVHGISSFGATLVDDADAATARTTLGLGTLATQSTITESQISDLQSYLTAETNDLSSAVTWANVPDANITESSVTQHEAALTITESQISDLGSYITASSTDTLTNKSGNISQWTNDSGYLTAETNNLSTVTGTLPIANGGTGETTAAAARVALLPTLGTAGQVLAVNTGTTDVEWVDAASGSGSGTVTSVAVSGSDGIEVDSGSPITSSGTIALGINASTLSSHLSLGTAATTASTDYATAAQGSTADSAVQPGDNANTLGSGAATDGYVLTADGSGGAAWEAVTPNLEGGVVINDSGADVDFRIESDTNANAFFLDGATGRVGINTNIPADKLHVNGAIVSTSNTVITATEGAIFDYNPGSSAGRILAYDSTGSVLQFYTNPNAGSLTERMRIDSSGNVLVGKTSVAGSGTQGVELRALGYGYFTASNAGTVFNRTDSVGPVLIFRDDNVTVGSVSVSGSSTAYNTSSDYRLKEDWHPMSGSIDRIKALNPVNFAWKVDGSRVDGFLAHEAQEVVPEAVTGEKDAVDAEGNPEYQGIDQAKLVPLLTAALQETLALVEAQSAKIDALETRIKALEV